MARHLPTIEQELQSSLLGAREALFKAQRDRTLEEFSTNTESSLLKPEEIQKSFETLAALKERYSALLKSMGGVDAVLKNLENYIIYEKLRDPRFAVDATYRETKREDFIPEKEQTNDHFNERGRYKAALRSLKLKLNPVDKSEFPEEERKALEVQFGSVFDEHSKAKIGPLFQGELKLQARELLAYFWLAASDPNMPISTQVLREHGSREKCIEAEKNNLVLMLASYQRAHNDGSYGHFNRLLDNPACAPGAWGRLFKEAPLCNQITYQGKPTQETQERQVFLDESILNFHIYSFILKQLYSLSAEQKLAFLNNYNNCYVFKTANPEDVLGFNLPNFVALLDKDLSQNFDKYWEDIISKTPDLLEIVKRQARDDAKSRDYIEALFYIKQVYRAMWEKEIAKIAQGLLHQQALYEPFEKDVLSHAFVAPYQKMLSEILEDSEEDRHYLVEIAKRMALLERDLIRLQASLKSHENIVDARAELAKFSQLFQTLLLEKDNRLRSISHKGHRAVLLNFLQQIPLLQFNQDKEIISKIMSAFFQEEELLAPMSALTLSEEVRFPEPTAAQKALFNNRYHMLNENWDIAQFGEKTPQKLFIEALRVFEGKPAFLQLNANQIAFLEKEKGLRDEVKPSLLQPSVSPLIPSSIMKPEQEAEAIERNYAVLSQAKPLPETRLIYGATEYFIDRIEYWANKYEYVDFETIIQKASEDTSSTFTNFDLNADIYILGEQTIRLIFAESLMKTASPQEATRAITLLNAAAEQNSITARNKLYTKDILALSKNFALEALAYKRRLLSANENEDKATLASNYTTALKKAAEHGSEIAKITLIQLWLMPEEVLPETLLEEQELVFNMACDASDYYPSPLNIIDAMTSLLLFLEKSPDPFVKGEAVKLKPRLIQRTLESNNVEEDNVVINAARLGHPLSQIQIISRVAEDLTDKEALCDYTRIFAITHPDILFLFEEVNRLAHQLSPEEKPLAAPFIKIVQNHYIQMLQTRMNHLLDEQATLEQTGKRDEATTKLHEINSILATLKRQGFSLKFTFALRELSSFRNALMRLPIRPQWLVEILAQMENAEQNIRLTTGGIQYILQQQRNTSLLEKMKQYFRSHRNTDTINIALAAYQTAESAYYKMLNVENLPKAQLETMLTELQTKKERLLSEIHYIIQDFQKGLTGESLKEQDIEFIDYLFRDKEPYLPARKELERFAFFQTLIEINDNVKRCHYIVESHGNQTNILTQTHHELSENIRNFTTEIRATKNQLAIAVDRAKNNSAAKQFLSLTEAEHALNNLQHLLNNTTEKGMLFYHQVAKEISVISARLEKSLSKTGSLSRISSILNVTNVNTDALLKKLRVQKTSLSKHEKEALTKKTAALHSLMESRKSPLEQEQHIKLTFSKQKESEVELFYTPAQLELARVYINTHLNVRDLCIDNPGREGAALQQYLENLQKHLNSGVYAEIFQWKKEPILITFQSLDGQNRVTVGVTKYTFDQYIEKAGSHKPGVISQVKYS